MDTRLVPRRTRWVGASCMLAAILYQALWLGLPAMFLSVALVISFGLWIGTHWRLDRRLRPTFLVGIVIFFAHATEEYLAEFHVALPALFDRGAWSDQQLLVFNGLWAGVFIAAAASLRQGRTLPVFIVLFFAIAGGVGNGSLHLLLVVRGGAYFPGAWTAIPCLLVGSRLLLLLYSTRAHVGQVLRDEVELFPHDPAWARSFRSEREQLIDCLPQGSLRRVEHFGSTAIPGIAAKPIVDMLVEVSDLNAVRKRIAPVLEARGYDYFWRPTRGDAGPPFYAWFIKRDGRTGARTHHIHMVEKDFVEHWDRLLFRDFLIERPGLASEYEELKLHLATSFPRDRCAYAQGKSEFIDRVTAEAKRYYGKA